MKRYALNISLALLFAAFMWSCQQQDPAPLSPEGSITLGKKGGKPPAATYTIEVFFDKNTDPAVEDFISVAKEEEAVTGSRGTAVSGNEMTPLNLTTELANYFVSSGETVDGVATPCFSAFFNDDGTFKEDIPPIVGQLSVGERDGDPYDAFGYFFTDDKVEPSLTMYMWGEILEDMDVNVNPKGAGVWLLPGPGEKLVITSNIAPPAGGDPNRLGIRIETGKRKTKDVCVAGIPNQPWRIVITLN